MRVILSVLLCLVTSLAAVAADYREFLSGKDRWQPTEEDFLLARKLILDWGLERSSDPQLAEGVRAELRELLIQAKLPAHVPEGSDPAQLVRLTARAYSGRIQPGHLWLAGIQGMLEVQGPGGSLSSPRQYIEAVNANCWRYRPGTPVPPSVSKQLLHDRRALVRIRSLGHDTVEQLDYVLAQLGRQGVNSIVLDLRGTSGYLHTAIGVAARFVPEGTVVTVVRSRTADSRAYKTDTEPHQSFELEVLVDEHTSWAGEALAACLRDATSARLSGTKTAGRVVTPKVFLGDETWCLCVPNALLCSADGVSLEGGVQP